jgi:hypothetical protein
MIKIVDGQVILPAGKIEMTQSEIARLFEVFVSAVGANIRSIFAQNLLDEDRVIRVTRHSDGSETTFYNLEMIAALAFRIRSRNASIFRRRLLQQALTPTVVCKIPDRKTIVS